MFFYSLAKVMAFGIASLGIAALIYRSYENRLDDISSRIDGLLDDPRSRLSSIENQVAVLANAANIRQSELDSVEANLATETSRVDTTCARVIPFFYSFWGKTLKCNLIFQLTELTSHPFTNIATPDPTNADVTALVNRINANIMTVLRNLEDPVCS